MKTNLPCFMLSIPYFVMIPFFPNACNSVKKQFKNTLDCNRIFDARFKKTNAIIQHPIKRNNRTFLVWLSSAAKKKQLNQQEETKKLKKITYLLTNLQENQIKLFEQLKNSFTRKLICGEGIDAEFKIGI